jgi:hypothetical protein
VRRSVPAGLAVSLACALLATGCSSGGNGDEMQIVQNPVAAAPAASPAASAQPAGTVFGRDAGAVTSMVADQASRTLAVAVQDPPSVRLYSLDDPNAAPRTVALAGPAEKLSLAPGQVLASIPGRGQVATIGLPSGQLGELPVAGTPAAATMAGGQTLVAVRDRKAVEVFSGSTVAKTITGDLYSADDVLNTPNGTVVLDRLRTALFSVDVPGGKLGEGLRAGDGAANAATDSFGRVLVTDTRAGGLLAFSTGPLLMRQRYPVPGGPYGIAYDAPRHLAWVTLTGRNEVVGFDVRGGEPVEKYRFATVRQPNTVTVDEKTAHVVVGSAAGEGIQVIQP